MLALTATVKAVISRLRNYVVLRLLLPVLFWELYKAGVKNLQHSPPQEPCSHLDSSIRRRKSSTTSTQASRICVTIRNVPCPLARRFLIVALAIIVCSGRTFVLTQLWAELIQDVLPAGKFCSSTSGAQAKRAAGN